MTKPKSENIVWHETTVSKTEREKISGHRGCTVWLTGLSGSGKSTLANLLEKALWERGARAYVLDGDNVRHGLNKDLGFSPEDREENIRRIGEVAALFTEAGIINVTAFISPYKGDRDKVREIMADGDFVEVYVKCDLDECEKRDPKGLYKKARAGEIPEFTGISAPYEEPDKAELIVDTTSQSQEDSLQALLSYLEEKGYLAA
ncbi:MAG: adenylyl-sulfate kinase [Proteobacteria bacterium]|nr:adenylyl-sulfate kinase [Pseudomonadota bacterium]